MLERINYLTMEPVAAVTPGAEVILQDDVILTSSKVYPLPEANHACLLRTDPRKAEGLIDEIVAYFEARGMPPVIMLSPACQPADLHQRLLARGFRRQEPDETWMVMENLQQRKAPKVEAKVQVRQITRAEAPLFAEVMTAAYEMPSEYADVLADLLAPSIGLPGITHFLAFSGGKAIATLSLMRWQDYVTIGSAGVLPEYRRGLPILAMAVEVLTEAQRQGVKTVLGQTVLGPLFERFLRFCGFSYAFKRVPYMLA
jgi:hypothetical protein